MILLRAEFGVARSASAVGRNLAVFGSKADISVDAKRRREPQSTNQILPNRCRSRARQQLIGA